MTKPKVQEGQSTSCSYPGCRTEVWQGTGMSHGYNKMGYWNPDAPPICIKHYKELLEKVALKFVDESVEEPESEKPTSTDEVPKETEKVCSGCGVEKKVKYFSRRIVRSRYQSKCKACQKKAYQDRKAIKVEATNND